MPPFIVSKMKLDAWLAAPPGGTTKLPAPAPATPPVGSVTRANVVVFTAPPAALLIVERLLPLLTGHHGDPALAARPQGLISRASCTSAGMSAVLLDQMLCMRYRSLGAAVAEPASTRPANATAEVTLNPRFTRSTAAGPPTSTLDRNVCYYAQGGGFVQRAARTFSPVSSESAWRRPPSRLQTSSTSSRSATMPKSRWSR